MKQSVDCDELMKAVKGGIFEEVNAILKLMTPKNHELFSAVSHLVLQLTVCYGYASLVESLLLQYKVQEKQIVWLCVYACISCKNIFSVKQVDILISKNQALQILYLQHHDNVYKTSLIIIYKKLTKSLKI